MFIDRMIYPVEALGPGKRLAIWMCGCSKHCVGCANPELWYQPKEKYIDCIEWFNIVRETFKDIQLDGITITGGDPLEQSEDLLAVLPLLKQISEDIIVYTGYKYEELHNVLSEEQLIKVKENVAVLIDGPYIERLNDGCSLRGSSNQNVIFFNLALKPKYEKALKEKRRIQTVLYNDKMISIGIHNSN